MFMTKINRLEMKGFKSFATKTEVFLGQDFNCVLGPNGSGKSNILDAICFVLGKGSAKAMRAEKSANLIYNGGKTKKPAGSGEVSIYFDNKERIFSVDAEELKITRIIKKTGQSKYKINDKTSTRNQILDMLSMAKINPDGYNIVLQGDVIRFTEMPTEKRRQVIEEIAGINVYEEKKQKALRELEKVKEQLNGAEIILKEKKSHLHELQKDRDQALKYKELNDQIRHNKAAYLKIQMEKKEAERDELDARKNTAQEEFEKYDKEIKALKEDNAQKRKELDDIAKEIESRGEKDQIDITRTLQDVRLELAKNKERINSCKNEIERISQRKEQLEVSNKELFDKMESFEKEQKDLEKRKETREKEKEQVEAAIEKFKQKNKLGSDVEAIDKSIEEIDKESEVLQSKISKLRETQQESIREKDKLEFMISTLDERINKVKEIEKEHKKELEAIKEKRDEFKRVTVEVNAKLNEDAKLASTIQKIRLDIQQKEDQLSKLQIRHDSAKEASMLNNAVEKVLANRKNLGGVHGTVASLGSVSSKYATALEIAAGGRIQSIIVDDDATAAKCIRFLKENKHGVASFLPLNKIREITKDPNVQKLAEANGAVDLAINLVKFDSAYKKAFSYVLGNTLVVENVDVGRRIGIGSARMVTLDGDLLDTSGAMQGGYRHKNKGIGFQEVEISKGLDSLEEEIADLRSEYASLTGRKNSLEAEVQKLREHKAELEGEIIKQEKSLHLDLNDLDSSRTDKDQMRTKIQEIEKTMDAIQDDLSQTNRDLAQLKVKRQQEKSKIMQLRNPTVLAELNTLEDKRKQIIEEIGDIRNEIKGIMTQVSAIFGPEKENINKILKQHEKETENFKNEIETLTSTIKKQEGEVKEKEEQEKKFYAQFKGLFQKRNSLQEGIDKNTDKLEGIQEKGRKAEHKMNTISLELARIRAEYSALEEDFAQYRDIKIKIEKTEEQYKKEIAEFEKMRENLGNINMRALEIYEQVEEEFNKLVEKKETLTKERDDVINMMDEIEKKKRDLFMNTYDIINKGFQTKFESLSTKGKAFLELENEKDPLAGGVGIKVRLSGSKYLDIRGLSGGEKTMTALAFIFAIQDHEPASFYVLDEVDAALDKHNSEKLAQLVRSYCNNAQYLVISHNDAVISEADNLYGISMNEHGISKVTSLKV